ncbi:hypothetical protein HF325_006824 [Metschnikowia pulcherrima]|uniref:Uncharacterized protein n=1 Tax=Metschnikowia pulcherrima TaxID=27326 RepID=A0A8H7GLW1_9ASCO|nr:hypothetical protein HF325_006824 [Metschnikowia pulcherrima]
MVVLRSSRRASGVNFPDKNKKRKNNSGSPVVAKESSTNIQIKNDPDSQAEKSPGEFNENDNESENENGSYPVDPDKVSYEELFSSSFLYDRKKQYRWTQYDGPAQLIHDASSCAPLPVRERPEVKYKDAAGEILTGENLASLPEVYFRYIAWFRREGAMEDNYATRSLQDFRNLFSGTKLEIDQIVLAMNEKFSAGFKQCLDLSDDIILDLVGEFIELGRHTVEAQLIPRMLDEVNPVFVLARQSELIGRAINGDIAPYITFLLVQKFSDNDIWLLVAPLLSKQCRDHKSIERFWKLMKRYKSRSDDVSLDLKTFLRALIEEDLFDTAWLGNGEDFVTGNYGSPRLNDSSQKPKTQKQGPKLKWNGEPYLPRPEYVKKMRTERMKEKNLKNGVKKETDENVRM